MSASAQAPEGVELPLVAATVEPPLAAGTRAKGEYRCSTCGYGVMIYRELPRCPMCGSSSWEQLAWSPFARAAALAGAATAP